MMMLMMMMIRINIMMVMVTCGEGDSSPSFILLFPLLYFFFCYIFSSSPSRPPPPFSSAIHTLILPFASSSPFKYLFLSPLPSSSTSHHMPALPAPPLRISAFCLLWGPFVLAESRCVLYISVPYTVFVTLCPRPCVD